MELTGDPLLIALRIALIGISVVFLALTLVALSLRLLVLLEARAQSEALPTPAATPASAGELPPVLIAVIAAAATEALGRPVRVTRIRAYSRSAGDGWSRQGRLAIMASHQRRGGGQA